MKKRTLSLLVAICILTAMVPTGTFATRDLMQQPASSASEMVPVQSRVSEQAVSAAPSAAGSAAESTAQPTPAESAEAPAAATELPTGTPTPDASPAGGQETAAPENTAAPSPSAEPTAEAPTASPQPSASAAPDAAPTALPDTEITLELEGFVPDANALPDAEEQFAGYVEQTLYGYGEMAAFGFLGNGNLSSAEKTIYDAMKAEITAVANGSRTSTQFIIDISALNIPYSDIKTQVNAEKIWRTLMADCPYELYWYDKTATSLMGPSVVAGGIVTKYAYMFPVSSAYATSTYGVDVTKTGAAQAAKANALAIVAQNAGKTDHEKLLAYKQAICDLVSYNFAAAGGSAYGDPWQVIFVFDKLPSTNVVCEGYAKGFQYLCDLSTFSDSSISCYSVIGSMHGGTGEGITHMWNIVSIGGQNYLVDLTNSDSGTVGQGGGLFLVPGTNGNVTDGYEYHIGSNTVTYSYNAKTSGLYGPAILTLAAGDYEVPPITISEPAVSQDTVTVGYTAPPTIRVTATAGGPISYQWFRKVGFSDTAVGTNSDTFTLPAGLSAGSYIYYCRAACSGESLDSGTVTITVSKKTGTLAANTGSSYAAVYDYTGAAIAQPAAENFITNAGPLSFTWYQGTAADADALQNDDRLTGAPAAVGSYTLYVRAASTAEFTAAELLVPVTIRYWDDSAAAVLSGENPGGNGWYGGTVTVQAPAGYTISADDTAYTASFDTTVGGSISYYLKNAEGKITAPKTIEVKIDTEAPSVPVLNVTSTADTTAELRCTSTDGESGIASYTLTETNGRVGAVSGSTTGIFMLYGLTPNTSYHFVATAEDRVGNTSVSESCTVVTQKTGFSAAALTLEGVSALSYNGQDRKPSAITMTMDGETVPADEYDVVYTNSNGGVGNTRNAGTVTVTATAKESGHYSGSASAAYTIAPAVPVITWGGTSLSLTYTGSAAAIAPPAVALVNGESCEESALKYSYQKEGAGTYTDGLPAEAGTYRVRAHLDAAGNYTAADSADLTVTIGKSAPTIAFSGYTPDKTYDARALANPTEAQLAITGAGYADVTFTWKQGTATLPGAPSAAGTYTLTAEIAATDNTDAAAVTSAEITIHKKALVITAKPQTITVGSGIATGTDQVTCAALAEGETLTDITLTPSGTGITENGTVTPSGAAISGDLHNYDVSYVAGTLVISREAPAIAWNHTSETLTYTGSAAVLSSAAEVTLPGGGTFHGTITYSYRAADAQTYTAGLPANAGSYAVKASVAADSNYAAAESADLALIIEKAVPAVGTVLYVGGTIYPTTPLSDVNAGLAFTGTAAGGTIALEAGTALAVGTSDYRWVCTPADTANYSTATGTISLTVVEDTLVSISTGTTAPKKTSYVYGEPFEVSGLTVTAQYAGGGEKEVTGVVTYPALYAGNTSITLSYSEGGITKTCNVGPITVAKKQLDVSGMNWGTADFAYDKAKHGLILSGGLPEGVSVAKTNDSAVAVGSYTASAVFTLAKGYGAANYEIIGTNPLTQVWSIRPAALAGTRSIGRTVRYTNTDTQKVTAAEFGITVAGSFARNGAVTDVGGVLAGAPKTGADVEYRLASGLAFGRQTVTIPLTFTPADSGYLPVEVTLTITLTDKAEATLSLTADKSSVVYGSSVAYTATLDKEHAFRNALDPLNGTIKFYLGDPADGGKVIGTAEIKGSGAQAVVTLGRDVLAAGNHTVYALYSGNSSYAAVSAHIATAVAAKQLAWDTGSLWAAKRADGSDTAALNGKLNVSGVLEGDSVGFTYTSISGIYDSAEAGERIVTVTVAGAAITSPNYVLPAEAPKLAGRITAVTELAPPVAGSGSYKLEKGSGIVSVPAALAGNAELNTPAKITAQMQLSIRKANADIPAENIEISDLTLMHRAEGSTQWAEVSAADFPAGGITVVLPYPQGTNAADFDFVVAHMLITGANAGTVETIAPEKTKDGLKFTLHSLSPIAVGYKAVSAGAREYTNTITTWVTDGGTVTPTASTRQGTDYTVTITPDKGYTVARVVVDGKDVGAVRSYTFYHVNLDHTLGVYFTKAGTGLGSPKTGDENPLWQILAAVLLSGTALLAAALYRRRKPAKHAGGFFSF